MNKSIWNVPVAFSILLNIICLFTGTLAATGTSATLPTQSVAGRFEPSHSLGQGASSSSVVGPFSGKAALVIEEAFKLDSAFMSNLNTLDKQEGEAVFQYLLETARALSPEQLRAGFSPECYYTSAIFNIVYHEKTGRCLSYED